ncbi:uncharacterized protein LOC130665544 [Microplitis mediator]|uniref:uncharacterized protein LOC130665544 n=1 Tax=Microplitis mediator TaxID=375433 RepID=UPI0025570B24|nr:uncharacterized protein LOC130665544 [Microplitis mediator]
MAYQENVDELLSDALSFNNELKTCNTIHNLQCNDDFLRLSGHMIPTIYGIETITIPQFITTKKAEKLPTETKYLIKSILSIKNSYLDKIKNVLNRIYPLIVININKFHTLRLIYDCEIKEIDRKPRIRQSVFAEMFNLTLQRIGHDIKDPKILYKFLTLLSEPLDWVDYYNIIKKYCHVNFMVYKRDLPTAKLFVHNSDLNSTPLILLHFTNSQVIDLIDIYGKGSQLFQKYMNL